MMNAIYAFCFEVARKASRYDALLIFAATRDLDPEALVETDTLLAHPEFQKRLDDVLRRSLPASLGHVIAVDEASEGFADQIARFAPAPAQMIRRKELDSIPTQTQSAIVIAGLVIESGRSLLDISRNLRRRTDCSAALSDRIF